MSNQTDTPEPAQASESHSRHSSAVDESPKASRTSNTGKGDASSPSATMESEAENRGDVESTPNSPDSQAPSLPPLPDEPPPPLPLEAPVDDGWQPVWDETHQAFYFFNKFTQKTTWTNPRVPEASAVPGPANHERKEKKKRAGGYNPAIHGDYDPNASYAQEAPEEPEPIAPPLPKLPPGQAPAANGDEYVAAGHFNRFTGKWQAADRRPENYSDESKSLRQMNAYFDVDSTATAHDGRSLRAERAQKKPTKDELKAFRAKRKEKKDERRRAWLRD